MLLLLLALVNLGRGLAGPSPSTYGLSFPGLADHSAFLFSGYFRLPVAIAVEGQIDFVRYLYAHGAFCLSQLIVPVCIAFSVLRYRLWDVDFFINRTIVYAIALALVAAVCYVTSKAADVAVAALFGKVPLVGSLASAAVSGFDVWMSCCMWNARPCTSRSAAAGFRLAAGPRSPALQLSANVGEKCQPGLDSRRRSGREGAQR